MNETFASVLLFHTALKNFLLATVGLTVDRTLSANDVILADGAGAFIRLQKKTNGATTSIGMELGTSADALETSTYDPERWFPFDTSAEGVFLGQARWEPEAKRITLFVMASGDRWAKRYRATASLILRTSSLAHQDHLNPMTEPNFKLNGGSYVQAGA
jgi:hypothetical protein